MPDPKAPARLFRNARREAVLVAVVWALALTWTVGYCWLHGYQHPSDSAAVQSGWARQRTAENFQHFGGIPDWVFIGILVPWLLCSVFTLGFCMGMKDDDLGAEAEESAEPEGGAEPPPPEGTPPAAPWAYTVRGESPPPEGPEGSRRHRAEGGDSHGH